MGNKTSHFLIYSFLAFSQASPLLKRIPDAEYGAGGFEVPAQGTMFVVLDGGIEFAYQIADANLVVYNNGVAKWNSQVSQPAGCMTNECKLVFQSDGDFVSYFNGVPTWSTGTGGGQGKWLAFYDIEPYIVVYDAANRPIWHTPITPPPPPPPSAAATPTVESSTTHPVKVDVKFPPTSHVAPPPTPRPTPQITTSPDPITPPPTPSNTADPHVIHISSPGPSNGPPDPNVIPVPSPQSDSDPTPDDYDPLEFDLLGFDTGDDGGD
jgi:hypothetical protein